jgi:hypothetical protein
MEVDNSKLDEILTLLKSQKKTEDVLTVEQWFDDSSVRDDARRNRLSALKIWAKSHGFDVEEPSRSKWKVRVSKEKVTKAAVWIESCPSYSTQKSRTQYLTH